MAGLFKKATRKRARLRLGLCGPSGSGKTYTALRLAFALAAARGEEHGRAGRVAVIDSESGSASKYVGESPDGEPWSFDVLELVSFAPDRYTEAMAAAAAEKFDVIVVDSLSHAWEGKDGALEMVDRKKGDAANGGNSFTAWKDVTPAHRRMVEALLTSPCDVICTLRAKTEYVLQDNDKGKKVPVKVGMGAIQRAGMEYEFDVFGELDLTHTLSITKTRCAALDGVSVVKPTPGFARPLIAWLTTGEAVEVGQAFVRADDSAVISGLVEQVMIQAFRIGWSPDRVAGEATAKYARPLAELGGDQLREFVARLERLPAKREPLVTEVEFPAGREPTPLERAASLRKDLFALIPDKDEQKKAWADLLARFEVKSAKDLQPEGLARFLVAVANAIQFRREGGTPFDGPAEPATAEPATA